MELTVREIIGAHQALSAVVQYLLRQKRAQEAYKAGRVLRQLAPEVELFNQRSDDLVYLYGEEKDGKRVVKAGTPAMQEYRADRMALLDTVISLPNVEPIALTPDDLSALDPSVFTYVAPVLSVE